MTKINSNSRKVTPPPKIESGMHDTELHASEASDLIG
jgi:hypothetical protein